MARAYPGLPPTFLEEAASIARRIRRRLRERRCRALTRAEPIDAGRTLVTVRETTPMLIDPSDEGLSRSLVADGYWEMWLTEALEAVLKPGMVAIDIGANLGYFSLLMAERVGASGRVHAFEPNPIMADLLVESAARSGLADRISLHRDPLWDLDGEASVLRVPDGEPKNAHLITHAGDEIEGIRMISRRLDGFGDLLDADVIKIDVEGAEERIWRGMAGLFGRGRPLTIFLEFSPVRYEDPMAFLEDIMAQGFTLGELSVSYGIRATTAERILAGAADEDRMLALRRAAQA
ncbi:FkbM family methyltransferase [Sphingomonas sp. BIUV-7]|uniref:FkbM family methyltransferase n=1 Tax=Sphingomonas natans TaxID=3063330 RepID=A0ABT8Y5T9_9SPHN|nr:FkbM family methyltransferase [Sphingomonas sp. BIUV-7]MDO6413688.1 FkbM family methyltransferase [Sphingomonas sp. BIUV-7]